MCVCGGGGGLACGCPVNQWSCPRCAPNPDLHWLLCCCVSLASVSLACVPWHFHAWGPWIHRMGSSQSTYTLNCCIVVLRPSSRCCFLDAPPPPCVQYARHCCEDEAEWSTTGVCRLFSPLHQRSNNGGIQDKLTLSTFSNDLRTWFDDNTDGTFHGVCSHPWTCPPGHSCTGGAVTKAAVRV